MRVREGSPGGGGRYWLLVTFVGLVAIAGYFGYVLYPRFDLSAGQGLGLLALAAASGIASFFSPCSFPLLLTLLGRPPSINADRGRQATSPVVFGGALAAGAALFMVLAGSVIALGGQALFSGVTFTSRAGITIRMVVGIALIILGLAQSGILRLPMHGVSRIVQPLLGAQAGLRRRHPVTGFALFGFLYVLAGFG